VRIPIQLITYQNIHLFILGITTNGVFQTWFEVNFLTGVFFIVLLPLTTVILLIGFCKENKTGKKLVFGNFFILLIVYFYLIIGIPILSQEIFGNPIAFLDIFTHFDYGFYILSLNLIISAIGYWKHPIE
jgi:ABC-type amino acid transport system permease subunit